MMVQQIVRDRQESHMRRPRGSDVRGISVYFLPLVFSQQPLYTALRKPGRPPSNIKKETMFNRFHAAALCGLAVLLAGCGDRKTSHLPAHAETTHIVRVEQSTSTFYPRNPGCTFDGVDG